MTLAVIASILEETEFVCVRDERCFAQPGWFMQSEVGARKKLCCACVVCMFVVCAMDEF